MAEAITISKTLSIRDCGKDEYWLQEQIADDPSILGLGELVVVAREKKQSSGGRLDLLLGEEYDGGMMYEVELMLGATDESHIIRTLEYWDLERWRWPKRAHTAVLVAEKMNRRFFNVIQLLSNTIPIVAIQVNVVEVAGNRVLHFTKILDAYLEPELEGRPQIETTEAVGEDFWRHKSPMTVACAKALYTAVRPALPTCELKYFKSGLTIFVGRRCFFWVKHKDPEKSLLGLWVDESRTDKVVKLLEKAGLVPVRKKDYFNVLVDATIIQSNANLFQQLGPMVEESWRDAKGASANSATE